MQYTLEDHLTGDTTIFDTQNVDYQFVWDQLGLNRKERRQADKIIRAYHEAENALSRELRIVNAHAGHDPSSYRFFYGLKSPRRAEYRHQADHYLTREQLDAISGERIAGSTGVVEKLIRNGVLISHEKWEIFFEVIREVNGVVIVPPYDVTRHHPQIHPQIPYKLNIQKLMALEDGEPNF